MTPEDFAMMLSHRHLLQGAGKLSTVIRFGSARFGIAVSVAELSDVGASMAIEAFDVDCPANPACITEMHAMQSMADRLAASGNASERLAGRATRAFQNRVFAAPETRGRFIRCSAPASEGQAGVALLKNAMWRIHAFTSSPTREAQRFHNFLSNLACDRKLA